MSSLIGKALAVRNAGPPVPYSGPRGGMSMFGPAAPDDEAYLRAFASNGTVNANVSLLARATAKPPWKLYRQQPKDGRVRYTTDDKGSDQRTEVVQHQALNVLSNPAPIQLPNGSEIAIWTRFSLFELSQVWLESCGKSYWVVPKYQGSSIPSGLWPVRPDRMMPVPDPENFLKGWVYTSPDGREKVPLNPDEVIFNRYPDPLDVYGGCGPIQSVLTDIEAARYAGEWNRAFFINSAEPGGVIQVDHSMDDDEFDQMMDRWRESHRGVARAHRVALLEGGATWVPNAHTMRDMDFAALRSVSRDIIREALAQHKVMTGVTDDVNRANAQTGEEVFASWSIVPRLDRWKDVLNSQFLPLFGSAGQGVEFDYSFPMPLNREQDNAELTAKATAAQLLVTAGFDPAAVLEVVGLPAMGFSAPAPVKPAPAPSAGDGGNAGDSGDMAARLRRMLANGHIPVEAARA